MTENKSLVTLIQEHLSVNSHDVPVFHAVAIRLQQVLKKPNFSMEEVTQLIVADQGLTSQVLRLANSAFYAGLNKVTNIREAIVRLGAQEVANIAMMATQGNLYHSSNETVNRTMQVLWRHALGCAIGSKWLAGKTGYAHLAQEAFLAGLLHDVGKLFLLKVVEELGKAGKLTITVTPPLIAEVMQSMHVEQGYALMQRWNMPEIYCEVVRDHHLPEIKSTNMLLPLTRLVDQACNKLGIGMCPNPSLVLFATIEAQLLGAKEITLAELEIAIEDAMQTLQKVGGG